MLALSYALVGLSLFGLLVFSAPVWAGDMLSEEVFSESERPVNGVNHKRLRAATVTTDAVDGLRRFELRLCEGLPTYAEAVKVEAIDRFLQRDSARMAPPKNAAFGLAKANRYGVDRCPAVVFDERIVVSGVTDLVDAVDRYEAWQREQAQRPAVACRV